MTDEAGSGLLDKVDLARRAALRELVIGAAYAVPVVASFAMSGLTSANALGPNCLEGNQSCPPVPVPSLTEQALPVFGAALGVAAVALVAKKTSET